MTDARWGLLTLLLVGCRPAVSIGNSDGSTGGTPDETSSGPVATVTSSTPTPVTSATSGPMTSVGSSADGTSSSTTFSDGSGDSSSSSSTGYEFITPPDGGPSDIYCDVWENLCLRGEACRPWSNDGSDVWNATRCIPVDDAPALVGDPCQVESGPYSGVDNCEAEAMCFDVDPDTLQGTCVAYCDGEPDAPVCADPTTVCVAGNDGVLAMCLPACDPLLQDCDGGQACVGNLGTDTGFFCLPVGTPYFNDDVVQPAACAVGQVGVLPELIDDCVEGETCCAPFCDIAEPNACAAGLECTLWLPEGSCPGLCDEAVCLSPP